MDVQGSIQLYEAKQETDFTAGTSTSCPLSPSGVGAQNGSDREVTKEQ